MVITILKSLGFFSVVFIVLLIYWVHVYVSLNKCLEGKNVNLEQSLYYASKLSTLVEAFVEAGALGTVLGLLIMLINYKFAEPQRLYTGMGLCLSTTAVGIIFKIVLHQYSLKLFARLESFLIRRSENKDSNAEMEGG